MEEAGEAWWRFGIERLIMFIILMGCLLNWIGLAHAQHKH